MRRGRFLIGAILAGMLGVQTPAAAQQLFRQAPPGMNPVAGLPSPYTGPYSPPAGAANPAPPPGRGLPAPRSNNGGPTIAGTPVARQDEVIQQMPRQEPSSSTTTPAPVSGPTSTYPTTPGHGSYAPSANGYYPGAAMAGPSYAPSGYMPSGPVSYDGPHYGGGFSFDGFMGGGAGRGPGLGGGIGVYYLQPYWEENAAFSASTLTSFGGMQSSSTSFVRDFDFAYDFSPRAWVSYTLCSGLGVRGRYWHYEEDAQESVVNYLGGLPNNPSLTIVTPAPLGIDLASIGSGDIFRFQNQLELDVYDLEFMHEMNAGCWFLTATGGVRYARLLQTYQTNRLREPADPLDTGDLLSQNRFQGLGPTASLEVRRMCWSGFSLYGSARGSVLFGDGNLDVAANDTVLIAPGGPVQVMRNASLTNRNDVLPVGEFELGAEWSMDCACYLLFVQAGYVGQTYFGAGSATSEDGNLGFTGFTVTAGFMK